MKPERPLTIGEALRLATGWLAGKGIPSARLDAELLTAEACGIRRLDLFLSPERPLTPGERVDLRELLRRRARREPVAYLLGRKEFYGLEIRVTPAVLIPRPETESLVDAVLDRVGSGARPHPRIVDVGTGSGAIACALASRIPEAEVLGVDLSEAALEIARENGRRLGLGDRVRWARSDLLEAVSPDPPWDVIVSNPPYVAETERESLDPDVRDFEPPEALFSGPEGVDHLRRLLPQALQRLRPGGFLVVETGSAAQRQRAWTLVAASFPPDLVVEVRDPSGQPVGLAARTPMQQEVARGR